MATNANSWQSELIAIVDRRFPQMVALRRHLHRHPEPSGHEQETSQHLYQLLGDQGFQVQMGPDGRGVIADPISGESSKAANSSNRDSDLQAKRIALRADIDALRIHESNTSEYCSSVDGIMHACGHDGHSAIVYGALATLNELLSDGKLPWPVSFRGIFQPSEETCHGAKEMIGIGALNDVDAIIATHLDPMRKLGTIGLRKGMLTANCDEISIHIRGRGGHAARPHEAHDPIAAAAQLINALYIYIPRVTDSQDAVVVTMGSIQGGDTANVIPEEVLLRGTIRSLNRKVRNETIAHIRRLAAGVAETSATTITIEIGLGCHGVNNDPQMISLLTDATQTVLGKNGVFKVPRPSMGSEDFAFYLDQIPGAMIRVGCTSDTTGGALLHSPEFDIDEQALAIDKILALTVIAWSKPQD